MLLGHLDSAIAEAHTYASHCVNLSILRLFESGFLLFAPETILARVNITTSPGDLTEHGTERAFNKYQIEFNNLVAAYLNPGFQKCNLTSPYAFVG